MKTIPTALANHYALPATTVATAMKVTRPDGEIYGFTSADTDETISAVLYRANPGLDLTSLRLTAGFAVDNLELTTLHDETVFTQVDLLSGRWNSSAFLLFEYNWASPSDGVNPLIAGTFGEYFIRRDTLVIELRGLQQYLQQPVGNVSTKLCRAHFADFPAPAGPSTLCRLDVADHTFSGSVTSVTSNQVFTDSTKAQASTFFNEGVLTWTSGLNIGLRTRVKTFASSVFTLVLPMLQEVQVGDEFSVVTGCLKRLDEDCKTKFNNVLNFQGEPHRPTIDALTESVVVDV
jgi:uncharacterized phage protein (TIGR02218 family)